MEHLKNKDIAVVISCLEITESLVRLDLLEQIIYLIRKKKDLRLINRDINGLLKRFYNSEIEILEKQGV